MVKKVLRWINDIPRDAAMNMALDEFVFNKYKGKPTLRIYYWNGPYTTIGYFQKADICKHNFVRRFTGGLTVQHHHDISYSFVISSDFWNVYNHHETYNNIHLLIQKTLKKFGIDSIILNKSVRNISSTCVHVLYENDLLFEGKKIVGSCSRRRANKLIIQGSIHVYLDFINRYIFSENFAKNISEFLKIKVRALNFSNNEIKFAKKIVTEKYLNFKWNNKY
ncbi:MAG: hypothetical protein LBJ68_00555 [Endomicrobium sp.]|jgi:lipoate-protein ligase A|nr:hypothetical protein [Endomicrobium sp.]